uniref:Domain of unknown function DB domain-containing protein n=1 Tax=Globodera rostochiensis TaxID=31243 RepID=A0A914I4B1_GLORO
MISAGDRPALHSDQLLLLLLLRLGCQQASSNLLFCCCCARRLRNRKSTSSQPAAGLSQPARANVLSVVHFADQHFDSQWLPQQTASWVPWQQQQQVVQQPWVNNNNHHHHHVDDHHPPPVHHDEDDHHHPHHHHHHFQQHYPPIRNGNNDNQQQQQAVIPYWQEQFSPLGADLAAASSSSPEFQEELPELYKPPIIQHVQTVGQHPQQQQQQNDGSRKTPNGSGGGSVNNAIFTHQQRQQQSSAATGTVQPTGAGLPAQPTGAGPAAQPTGAGLPAQPTGAGPAAQPTGAGLPAQPTGAGPAAQPTGAVSAAQSTGAVSAAQPTGAVSAAQPTGAGSASAAQRAALNNILRRIIPAVRLPPNTAVAAEKDFVANDGGNDGIREVCDETTCTSGASSSEFDLPPPPPPSRFLPDVEKARIAEHLRHKGLSTPRDGVASDAIPSEEPSKFGTLLSTTVPTISTETAATTTPAPARLLTTTTATTPSQKTPNESFLHCCRAKRVPKICESRCNFEVLNKKTLTALFLNTDKCPSEYGLELFTCAAQDSDHSECCKAKRVQRTAAGNKCLAFCNLSPEAPRVQADASYLPCWAVLNEIKNCFRDKLTAHDSKKF